MTATTITEPALSHEVEEFLLRHEAHVAFAKVRELVRECFPDYGEVTYRLLDDPDTEDRVWLVVQIELPGSVACTEDLRDREREYHTRFVTEVPLSQCPHFALTFQFTLEET